MATETRTTDYVYSIGWYNATTDKIVDVNMECTTRDLAEARRYCEDIAKHDVREMSDDETADGGVASETPLAERADGYQLVWCKNDDKSDGKEMLCMYRVQNGWVTRRETLLRCYFIVPIMAPIDEEGDDDDETYRPAESEDDDDETLELQSDVDSDEEAENCEGYGCDDGDNATRCWCGQHGRHV